MAEEKKAIVLRVEDPERSQAYRNIVTLDTQSKEALGITSGDIVEIEGTKITAATVWPAREEDEGRGIIRMDSLTRKNCGAGLGDKVTVRKANVKEAKTIVLAPTENIRIVAQGYESILKKILIGKPLMQNDLTWISLLGTGFVYKVVSTTPKGIVKVVDTTKIQLKEEPVKEGEGAIPSITYDDIGGLKEQIEKVREMIELPMKHPEIFRRLGVDPPKGVLMHGPPGTGKTLLAKAVANETNAHFISVSSPSIMSKYVGEAEKKIREIFKEAVENAPSIIFFDEIDSIAPKREETTGEVERRVVAQLLSLMDGMEARGNVIVIAATNRVNSIDEALRRPGRFDREIEFPVPNKKARKQILEVHTRGMPLADDVDLQKFANLTHGFVGADLQALTKEAAMKALRRYLPELDLDEENIPMEILEKMQVTQEDFENALKEVQPSALREVVADIPNVKWEDVGGLEKVKEEIKEAVEYPLKYPDAFKEMGIRAPKGILLYGPPGTGKTLLAKAAATESEANFISIKGPELLSKWVGESEKGIRNIFKRARQVSPSIIFFDEIDSIAPARGTNHDSEITDRIVNQILTELDGIEELKDVVVIAATNRPDLIDPALLRQGRLDKLIHIPAPDKKARLDILKIHTKNVPIAREGNNKVDLEELAEKTEGYTGADIEGLVREAAMIALKENKMKRTKVLNRHFKEAMKKIKPSVSREVKDGYEEFKRKYDSEHGYVG